MGIRTHVEVSVTAGLGATIEDVIFNRDISELLDTLDRATAMVVTLAGGETDFAVSLGDIAQGRMIYVEADGEVDVKLFGAGGTALPVKRPINPASSSAADVIAYLLATCQFTSLHLTNPDATNSVTVRVLIVGDLVA